VSAIRVVHVANFDLGMKIHLGNYLRYLRDQGYAVSAVTHPGSWLKQDSLILDGIFVKVLPFNPRLSPGTDFTTFVRLAGYFRRERFDVVHTHTIKPGLLGRLAARLAGVPVVVHTVHGFYFYEGMSPAQKRLYRGIEALGAACSDLLLSQNRQDMAVAVREKICSAEKITFLDNGIDLARFNRAGVPAECVAAYRMDLGLQPGEKVVGFIGRFEREKGIYELLEAARRLKHGGLRAKYVLIGASQPAKGSAVSPQAIIRQHDLDGDVLLLGFRDDVTQLLALMDLVVLPSYHEGKPRSLMESAAFGIPVVATRVVGITEVVADGITGLLVPVRDPAALAEAIACLLQDPARARAMGQAARCFALEHFDERAFFWKTDREYRRLLESKLGKEVVGQLKPVPSMETAP